MCFSVYMLGRAQFHRCLSPASSPCLLGCSKLWEYIFSNLAGLIIFESRLKFGILDTINPLILLEKHGYITSI